MSDDCRYPMRFPISDFRFTGVQMWIMVAGPYRTGSADPAVWARNLRELNKAAYAVFRKGHVPIVAVNLVLPIIAEADAGEYARIMTPLSLSLTDRCDAVLRIGGPSVGADEEVSRFEARGLPVFRSLDEIPPLEGRFPGDGVALPAPEAGLGYSAFFTARSRLAGAAVGTVAAEVVMWKGLLLSSVAIVSAGCAPLLHSPFVGAPRTRAPFMGGPATMPPAPGALPFGRWDNVMRVPRMSVLDVLDSQGAAHVGQILSADIQQVTLLVSGSEVTIARGDVVRVDLVRAAGTASGPRRVARGALLGAGAAVLFGAVVGGEAWPPPGALVRGGAAIGGLTAAQAAALDRQGQILYIAP